MKLPSKYIIFSTLFAFVFGIAAPARAFYLYVPDSVTMALEQFKIASSHESTASQPLPPPEGSTGTQPPSDFKPTPPPEGSFQPVPPEGSFHSPEGSFQPSQPDGGFKPMPPTMGPGERMMGTDESMKRGMEGRPSMSDEERKHMMRGMQQGARAMERQIKEFERMLSRLEKSGSTIPEDARAKIAKAKEMIEQMKNAQSSDDVESMDGGQMEEIMQLLDEIRREVIEKAQRTQGIKQALRGMETGLKMFERQVARLTKQNIPIPTNVQENINKLKTLIDAVKNAKTWEEIEALGLESMHELMEQLNESRQQLEVLARWPQTIKQIDRELARLTRELKRDKGTVDRLAKRNINLQDVYAAFETAVTKLKAVRDDAVAKMNAGNSEAAFDALENDFFGQMEDVWQHHNVIMMMSNLGRFNSEFKREIARAESIIRKLKRQKVDTGELEALLAQAKAKGEEILSFIKSKETDSEVIKAAFDEMENIGQEFDDMVAELTGDSEELPWEKGPQQFRRVDLPSNFDKFVPRKAEPREHFEGEGPGSDFQPQPAF